MAKKKKRKFDGVVYSTDPDFDGFDDVEEEAETLPPNQQTLRLRLDRLKGNKIATVVYDFVGADEDLKDLGKQLKGKCGVGGSVKEGEIILQGNHREKVNQLLKNMGYRTKLVGG